MGPVLAHMRARAAAVCAAGCGRVRGGPSGFQIAVCSGAAASQQMEGRRHKCSAAALVCLRVQRAPFGVFARERAARPFGVRPAARWPRTLVLRRLALRERDGRAGGGGATVGLLAHQ
eukprot:2669076-Prymnesium_polylepis.1